MRKILQALPLFMLLGGFAMAALAAPHAAKVNATPMPMSMPMATPVPASAKQSDIGLAMTPESGPASPVTGTEWSVFNHRGSGFFIFLWGLTAFIAGLFWPKQTWFRFVPPLAMFGLAEFLILRNDPKAWPIGPIGFWVSLQDPAVLEHRIFVLLIIAIGVLEMFRAAGKLPKSLQLFGLPALAVFGAIFLFFHKHGGLAAQQMMLHASDPAMATNPAMEQMNASMALIKHEHFWFSMTGFGLAAAKLLADGGILKGRLGATLWSVFAVILGIYMMTYLE
jgi:hypothetical protein